MTNPPQHPEDVDKNKEYPVTFTFRMASFILNCTSFLVNNSRGDLDSTVQSFELAMNDLRAMGPDKYNEMMERVVDILKTDPEWKENLQVFRGEDQPPSEPKPPPTRVIMPRSKLIQ